MVQFPYTPDNKNISGNRYLRFRTWVSAPEIHIIEAVLSMVYVVELCQVPRCLRCGSKLVFVVRED